MYVQSSKPTKKRKLTKPVTRACATCRKKHEKCDGGNPCAYCQRTGAECVYLAPKKRGPPKGARKVLQERIRELEARLSVEQAEHDRCKQQLGQLQERAFAQSQLDVMAPSIRGANSHLTNTSALFGFVNCYKQTPGFTTFVEIPSIDIESLWRRERTGANFNIFSVLSIGAMAMGDLKVSAIFHKEALEMGRDLYDKPSFDVASGYLLMAYHLFGEGDFYKAMYYISLANTMIQYLHTMQGNKRLTTQQTAIIRTTKLYRSETKSLDYDTRLNIIQDLAEDINKDGDGMSLNTKNQLFFAHILRCILEVDFALSQGKFRSESATNDCFRSLMHAERLHSETFAVSSGSRISPLMECARAKLYLAIGNPEIAKKSASLVTSTLAERPITQHTPFTCFALKNALEVHAAVGEFDMASKDVAIMDEVGKYWPICKVAVSMVRSAGLLPAEDLTQAPQPSKIAPTMEDWDKARDRCFVAAVSSIEEEKSQSDQISNSASLSDIACCQPPSPSTQSTSSPSGDIDFDLGLDTSFNIQDPLVDFGSNVDDWLEFGDSLQ